MNIAKKTLIIWENPASALNWLAHWSNESDCPASEKTKISIHNNVVISLLTHALLTFSTLVDDGRLRGPPFVLVDKTSSIPESQGVDGEHTKLSGSESNPTHVCLSRSQASWLLQTFRIHRQQLVLFGERSYCPNLPHCLSRHGPSLLISEL